MFAVVGVVIVVVQGGLVRPAVRAAGESRVLLAGLLLNGIGLGLLAGVHSFVALAPAILALTVGQGLVSPTLSSTLAGKVTERPDLTKQLHHVIDGMCERLQ